jgi:hypothetical protein
MLRFNSLRGTTMPSVLAGLAFVALGVLAFPRRRAAGWPGLGQLDEPGVGSQRHGRTESAQDASRGRRHGGLAGDAAQSRPAWRFFPRAQADPLVG